MRESGSGSDWRGKRTALDAACAGVKPTQGALRSRARAASYLVVAVAAPAKEKHVELAPALSGDGVGGREWNRLAGEARYKGAGVKRAAEWMQQQRYLKRCRRSPCLRKETRCGVSALGAVNLKLRCGAGEWRVRRARVGGRWVEGVKGRETVGRGSASTLCHCRCLVVRSARRANKGRPSCTAASLGRVDRRAHPRQESMQAEGGEYHRDIGSWMHSMTYTGEY